MANLTELVFKTVGRHFVTLSGVQRRPGAEAKQFVFSGFLVLIDGIWFYVTAGHILRDIRESLAQGATWDIWRLDDQTAGSKFNGAAVPYAFDLEKWLVLEDEAAGLDYAAVPLEAMYRMQLEAGRAVPIDSKAWGDYVTEHDHWLLVGIPSESVQYDGKSIITGRITLLPLEDAAPPPGAGPKVNNQFYARFKGPVGFKDLDGMSGGPVFALKKVDSQWRYTVIGVQSGWYRQADIIAACPFSTFGRELERLVMDAKAKLAGLSPR